MWVVRIRERAKSSNEVIVPFLWENTNITDQCRRRPFITFLVLPKYLTGRNLRVKGGAEGFLGLTVVWDTVHYGGKGKAAKGPWKNRMWVELLTCKSMELEAQGHECGCLAGFLLCSFNSVQIPSPPQLILWEQSLRLYQRCVLLLF